MRDKISTKTKVIIFIIVAICGIVSIAYNNKEELWNFNIYSNSYKRQTEVDKSALDWKY